MISAGKERDKRCLRPLVGTRLYRATKGVGFAVILNGVEGGKGGEVVGSMGIGEFRMPLWVPATS